MDVDTKAMRELIDASPGTLMAVEKAHLHAMLNAIEHGQTVEQQLAGIRSSLRTLAIAA